jgi:hypothetical protein
MDKDEGEMPEIRALVHELGELPGPFVAIIDHGDRSMSTENFLLFSHVLDDIQGARSECLHGRKPGCPSWEHTNGKA